MAYENWSSCYWCRTTTGRWIWDEDEIKTRAEYDMKLNWTEMSMMRRMYRVTLNEKQEKWSTYSQNCQHWNQTVRWSGRVGWNGLDMLNIKMIMTGSNVVWCGNLKEFDRQDAWKDLVTLCEGRHENFRPVLKKMCSLGINEEQN